MDGLNASHADPKQPGKNNRRAERGRLSGARLSRADGCVRDVLEVADSLRACALQKKDKKKNGCAQRARAPKIAGRACHAVVEAARATVAVKLPHREPDSLYGTRHRNDRRKRPVCHNECASSCGNGLIEAPEARAHSQRAGTFYLVQQCKRPALAVVRLRDNRRWTQRMSLRVTRARPHRTYPCRHHDGNVLDRYDGSDHPDDTTEAALYVLRLCVVSRWGWYVIRCKDAMQSVRHSDSTGMRVSQAARGLPWALERCRRNLGRRQKNNLSSDSTLAKESDSQHRANRTQRTRGDISKHDAERGDSEQRESFAPPTNLRATASRVRVGAR